MCNRTLGPWSRGNSTDPAWNGRCRLLRRCANALYEEVTASRQRNVHLARPATCAPARLPARYAWHESCPLLNDVPGQTAREQFIVPASGTCGIHRCTKSPRLISNVPTSSATACRFARLVIRSEPTSRSMRSITRPVLGSVSVRTTVDNRNVSPTFAPTFTRPASAEDLLVQPSAPA